MTMRHLSQEEDKPGSSATEMAAAMGIDLLTEEQYQELQKVGPFDTKTSSWLKTPVEIESSVVLYLVIIVIEGFHYHNGAESYYE